MAVRKGKAAAPETGPVPSRLSPRQLAKGYAPSAGEVPATCAMLAEVRTEVLLRIDGAESRLMGEINGLKADVARIGFLIEEQNARNKVVLDALLWTRGPGRCPRSQPSERLR